MWTWRNSKSINREDLENSFDEKDYYFNSESVNGILCQSLTDHIRSNQQIQSCWINPAVIYVDNEDGMKVCNADSSHPLSLPSDNISDSSFDKTGNEYETKSKSSNERKIQMCEKHLIHNSISDETVNITFRDCRHDDCSILHCHE